MLPETGEDALELSLATEDRQRRSGSPRYSATPSVQLQAAASPPVQQQVQQRVQIPRIVIDGAAVAAAQGQQPVKRRGGKAAKRRAANRELRQQTASPAPARGGVQKQRTAQHQQAQPQGRTVWREPVHRQIPVTCAWLGSGAHRNAPRPPPAPAPRFQYTVRDAQVASETVRMAGESATHIGRLLRESQVQSELKQLRRELKQQDEESRRKLRLALEDAEREAAERRHWKAETQRAVWAFRTLRPFFLTSGR